MKVNGIVLSAGYGSRMAPLTRQIPKPVLPLAGVPILVRILKRMTEAGIGRIAVNTHHLKEKVEKCVLESPYADRVQLFYEEEILGTGGPLVNAKSMLRDCDCFLLHNGDIVCTADLKALIQAHLDSGAMATMLLLDGPENRVCVEDGFVSDILGKLGRTGENAKQYTYCGVSVYSPEFFRYLPEEPCCSSLPEAWLAALRDGKKIQAYFPGKSFYWNDIGSFEQYFSANKALMLDHAAPDFYNGPAAVFGKDCEIDPSAKFTGFVTAGEHCRIGADTHLHHCILLPGAAVRKGYSAWEVFGKTFSCHKDAVSLAKLPILRENCSPEAYPISLPEQGSDRKFYRIEDDGTSKILMLSNERDADFDRFLNLGAFFSRHHLRTPEIYASDRADYAVLMEDLGDGTIAHRMEKITKEAEAEVLYRKVLDALAEFQVAGTRAIGSEDREFRIFTRKLLRWESDYFRENFLGALCALETTGEEERALKEEFDQIAGAVEKMPYTLIHRDFQSQNILLQGDAIRFVDFQGARLGPYTYDAASLIKDPYVPLSMDLRDRLFRYHHEALNRAGFEISAGEHALHAVLSSLQRNMQALGAYGFLSLKKGKMKYLAYASPCLELLADGISKAGALAPEEFKLNTLRTFCDRARWVLPERIGNIINPEKKS